MASTLQQPAPLVEPFANSGDRNIIPQAATGTQKASLTEGFPPVTQLPIDRGGIPPERQDFNALGYLTTSQYFFLQNGGRFTFNPAVSAAIGGYPAGATLWYNDTARGVWYPVTSVINNNTYNFVQYPTYIDGTKWKRAVDAFPTSQITNCITEIPQDIKLELNSGTLTLQAGSKVYVPNGTGVFDEVIVPSDVVFHSGTIGGSTVTIMLFCDSSGGFGQRVLTTSCAAGTTNPGSGYNLWYDTTNNKIKYSQNADGNFDSGGYSLPVGIYQRTNGVATSIDQIFNGFGYMDSTIFALPGVKSLIPNGRNEDGTLNNIENIISSVKTITLPSSATYNGAGIYLSTTEFSYYARYFVSVDNISNIPTSPSSLVVYDESTNTMVLANNGVAVSTIQFAYLGHYSSASGAVLSLNTLLPFRAADYNDIVRLEQRIQVVHGALPEASDIVPGRIYFVTV